jgi:hypothetical protein
MPYCAALFPKNGQETLFSVKETHPLVENCNNNNHNVEHARAMTFGVVQGLALKLTVEMFDLD